MAKLDNVVFSVVDGKLTLTIDTGLSVGTTKDGSGTYFVNTGGPTELPGFPGVKLALAMWYKELKPAEATEKPAATTVKASGIKLGSSPAKAAPAAKAPTATTVKINHVKG